MGSLEGPWGCPLLGEVTTQACDFGSVPPLTVRCLPPSNAWRGDFRIGLQLDFVAFKRGQRLQVP